MKTAKWDKPLSKRAYDKIKEKALIGVTIAGREDDFDEFIETIDIYIEKGKVVLPWGDRHDIYDIIFHMIKDDIDTAMRRSREARERAAARRRKASDETVVCSVSEEESDVVMQSGVVGMTSANIPSNSSKPPRHKRHKGRRYDELPQRGGW